MALPSFSPSKVVIKRELGRSDPARKGMPSCLEHKVNIVVHEAATAGDVKTVKKKTT